MAGIMLTSRPWADRGYAPLRLFWGAARRAPTTGATLSRMADAMVMFDGLLHEAGDQVRVRPAADFEAF